MIDDNQIRLYQFYQAVLERLEYMYPEFQEKSVGMLKVLHAFSDKPPLIKALVNRDLLAGVVLKKKFSRTAS